MTLVVRRRDRGLERLWRPRGAPGEAADATASAQADRRRRGGRYAEAAHARGSAGWPSTPATSPATCSRRTCTWPGGRSSRPSRSSGGCSGRDPSHPRALLGLARIALEEGDLDGVPRGARARAARLPGFPGGAARCSTRSPRRRERRRRTPAPPVGWTRLRMPGAARALIVVRADGARSRRSRPDDAKDVGRALGPDAPPRRRHPARARGSARSVAPIVTTRERRIFLARRRRAHARARASATTPIHPGAARGQSPLGGRPARARPRRAPRHVEASPPAAQSGECHESIEAGARAWMERRAGRHVRDIVHEPRSACTGYAAP